MSKNFSNFTLQSDLQDSDHLVGYRSTTSSRWTWASIKAGLASLFTAVQNAAAADATSKANAAQAAAISTASGDATTKANAAAAASVPVGYLDTDVALAANSNTRVPSQKAVKTYIDAAAAPAHVIVDSTTSRTLGLVDLGRWIQFTNASAITVTVPPASDVNWPADSEIFIEQAGTGQITVSAGAGVTVNSSSGALKSSGRYAVIGIKRVDADIFTLTGDRA